MLGTFLQIAVVVIKPVADLFNLVPLTAIQWLYTLGISILPLIIMEVQKKINEVKFGKIIYGKENLIKNKEI